MPNPGQPYLTEPSPIKFMPSFGYLHAHTLFAAAIVHTNSQNQPTKPHNPHRARSPHLRNFLPASAMLAVPVINDHSAPSLQPKDNCTKSAADDTASTIDQAYPSPQPTLAYNRGEYIPNGELSMNQGANNPEWPSQGGIQADAVSFSLPYVQVAQKWPESKLSL